MVRGAGADPGSLLIGLFTRYVLPGRLPQGVPQVMEAAALKNGRMPMRDGIAAAFISAASLGCGASVGREGPIVHLGATLASFVARRMQLSPSLAKTLLGCGVAAAVASAFNAPIAGVIFVLEAWRKAVCRSGLCCSRATARPLPPGCRP